MITIHEKTAQTFDTFGLGASVMTLLQQHLNDFNNPHHVTAAQVQS